MLRRIGVALAAVAAAVIVGVSAPAAQAAATCTTHSVDLVAWSENTNTISYNTDFKCGGMSTNYRLHIFLQQKQNGVWGNQQNCVSGGLCDVYKPGSGASDWYGQGLEKMPGGSFTTLDHIANLTFRIRVVVKFQNGDPDIQYNSNQQVV